MFLIWRIGKPGRGRHIHANERAPPMVSPQRDSQGRPGATGRLGDPTAKGSWGTEGSTARAADPSRRQVIESAVVRFAGASGDGKLGRAPCGERVCQSV